VLQVKRVYDPVEAADGARFLVDRLWPRGVKKTDLSLRAWLKDVAPSHALRTWYHHDPQNWNEFCRRYRQELEANPAAWQGLLESARRERVTLLYSARDRHHNQALVLKAFLEERLS
jgi:uncharacterized protein YeaO (DUF488 family)